MASSLIARLILPALAVCLFCGNAVAQTQQNQGNTGTTGNNQNQTGLNDLSQGPNLNTELGGLSNQMSEGFLGANTDTENFVGSNSDLRNQGRGNVRNFQNRNTTGNVNQLNQARRVTQGTGVESIVYRPRYRIAFDIPRPSARQVDLKLGNSLRKISSRKTPFPSIAYRIGDDQTVTLTGTVANEGEKQLAQLYFQMEPGVNRVINEIEVQRSTPEPPPSPE